MFRCERPSPTALIMFPLAAVPLKSHKDACVSVQLALPKKMLGQVPEKHFLESSASPEAGDWFFIYFPYWFVLVQLSPG